MNKPREIDPDRVAELQEAVDAYQAALTKAELIEVRAEQEMAAALRKARSGRAIPWRVIAEMFGHTHQAVMYKWQDKIKSSRTATDVVRSTNRTEPNRSGK